MAESNRSLGLVLAILVVAMLNSVAAGYVSCEHMHVVSMRSNAVVDAVLIDVTRESVPRVVHGRGRLVVSSAAFGASPGDTLDLEWDYANGVWGAIKSPADRDHGEWEGQNALWFLRQEDDGSFRTTSMYCSVYDFGEGASYVLRWLSGPPVYPRVLRCDPETDGWKSEAVHEYLMARVKKDAQPE